MKLMTWLWVGLALVPAAKGTEPASASLIRNGDFEQWEWREFSDAQRKAVKGMLAEGKKLSDLDFEIRGPLARGLAGYGELRGMMVEGKDAWQGRSLLLAAGDKDLEWGYHWMLLKQLKPGGTYNYDVMLKGTGKFMLKAEIGGKNPATGAFKWFGFPYLLSLAPGDTWNRYQGTITVPNMGSADMLQDPCSISIALSPNSKICIDNFNLWEAPEK